MMMYPIVSTVTQTVTLLLRFMSFFEDAAMFQHFDADLLHTLSSSNCIDMYPKNLHDDYNILWGTVGRDSEISCR